MKTLIAVQRPFAEKIALIAIFSIGGFATIVSIIRLYSIRVFTSSDNPTEACIPVRTHLETLSFFQSVRNLFTEPSKQSTDQSRSIDGP